MKKMIALGMAAIMCLSMTACSVSTSSKTETTAAATEAAETTAEAASTKGASDEAVLHIGSLKGPTTMGLVSLMDKASKGESEGSYDFTMVTDASELAAQMVSGDLDIALVPANLASILYQPSNRGRKTQTDSPTTPDMVRSGRVLQTSVKSPFEESPHNCYNEI